jgi:histidinol-phosphatase
MNPDLAFAEHLADVAADVTMPSFGARHQPDRKDDDTVVTAIDRAAEHAIRAAVREQFPRDGVRGEEEGLDPGTSGRVWVIDPIDGTRMYVEGIPTWTTLIGLRDDSGTLVGVADAPALGERATAARGGGAWLDGRQLQVSTIDRLEDAFVLHASIEEFAAVGQLDALVRLATSARGSRGIAEAWAHLLIARGAAEVLLEVVAGFEWDWCATALILAEAGGSISAAEGGAPYDGCQMLVTNGLLDDAVRSVLDLPASAPRRPPSGRSPDR